MELKGSETEKNLLKAFECEALRKCEYLMSSFIARLQGYEDAGRELEKLSDNEREHAKLWLRWLNNGKFPNTEQLLTTVLQKENEEAVRMYPEFAQKARQEGHSHIADLFEYIAKIEREHVQRLNKILLSVKDDVTPNSDGTFNWECSNCGAVITQHNKPDFCPLCSNEAVFFFKKQNK